MFVESLRGLLLSALEVCGDGCDCHTLGWPSGTWQKGQKNKHTNDFHIIREYVHKETCLSRQTAKVEKAQTSLTSSLQPTEWHQV